MKVSPFAKLARVPVIFKSGNQSSKYDALKQIPIPELTNHPLLTALTIPELKEFQKIIYLDIGCPIRRTIISVELNRRNPNPENLGSIDDYLKSKGINIGILGLLFNL